MTVRTREDIARVRLEAGHPIVYTAFPADTIDDPVLRTAWTIALDRYTELAPAMERVRQALRRPSAADGRGDSNEIILARLDAANDDLLYLLKDAVRHYDIADPVTAEAWGEAATLARVFLDADASVTTLLGQPEA